MKKLLLTFWAVLAFLSLNAQETKITSPDGKMTVIVDLENGKPFYKVLYDGKTFLDKSPLGLKTNIGDYTQNLKISASNTSKTEKQYRLKNIKQSLVDFKASLAEISFEQDGKKVMNVVFSVSDRDAAFKYRLFPKGETRVCVIEDEVSGFKFPDGTTTFLCPQSKPMGGFARTSPSYETPYTLDAKTGTNGWGNGFTFPCLFKNSSNGWILVSETGTDGRYVGCRLLNKENSEYKIGFPQPEECNGIGSVTPAMSLPGETPWRTITLGSTLKNIVETTVPFDLTEPKYFNNTTFTYGKGSWSWIIGMDPSCNFDEQKRYIDFSAAMGYQSVLIDAFWDRQIGYDKIKELADYGRTKGVGLFLWYNSNGTWNDAPQTPIDKMNTSSNRRKEMKWLQETGIRGIKVDFFAGDKQQTIQLYEDILTDANEFGLLVIFHGCTLPRGWEKMYPNYAASEAVLASENLHFSQDFCNNEAKNATIHPFVRNTVGSMDFGGSALNKFYNADNQHGTKRMTSEVFALATAVLFQSAVQHFALAPNNLTDASSWAIDFMKKVPTTWDEVKFIDGYPGKYVILARRSGDKWYIAGVNAEEKPLVKTIDLPMFKAEAQVKLYSDDNSLNGSLKEVKTSKKQQVTITIPCNGGVVIMK
ncbi:MAG: glycoside hydrolase family 97 protein [Bacteroidales bacterium]|nr:glycoside hydrolase family 97 protein [Bacteroidales bacterium]